MNGLPLRSLTPDSDALLTMPRSALYCELGFTLQHSVFGKELLCILCHLSALTPGFPMIFTCLPAALFALIHDTFIQLPHVYESVRTRAPPGNLLQEEKYKL